MRLINLVSLLIRKTLRRMKKVRTLENVNRIYKGRQKVFHGIESKIFTTWKQAHGRGHLSDLATRLKILTPKQMLQRLPITFD